MPWRRQIAARPNSPPNSAPHNPGTRFTHHGSDQIHRRYTAVAADAGLRAASSVSIGARRFSRSDGRCHRARDQLADIAPAPRVAARSARSTPPPWSPCIAVASLRTFVDDGPGRRAASATWSCSCASRSLDLAGLVLRVYLFALLLYWLTSFVSPGGYAPGVAPARATLRTGLEACAPGHSADRSDRFFGALGVDRDRRLAGAASLNIASYMPEITVNEPLTCGTRCSSRRGSLKNQRSRARCARIFFRNCAKHRLFSMLFSAPS